MELLAEREAQRKSQKGRSNRVVFFAMQAEIKEALDEGWTVVQIYRVLQAEGRVKFSYQSFRLYVNKLILNPGQTRRKPKEEAPLQQQDDKPKGFFHNPVPNKDELY